MGLARRFPPASCSQHRTRVYANPFIPRLLATTGCIVNLVVQALGYLGVALLMADKGSRSYSTYAKYRGKLLRWQQQHNQQWL